MVFSISTFSLFSVSFFHARFLHAFYQIFHLKTFQKTLFTCPVSEFRILELTARTVARVSALVFLLVCSSGNAFFFLFFFDHLQILADHRARIALAKPGLRYHQRFFQQPDRLIIIAAPPCQLPGCCQRRGAGMAPNQSVPTARPPGTHKRSGFPLTPRLPHPAVPAPSRIAPG